MRAPYLDDGDVRLYLGDCIEVLAEMEPESVDAICTDPPYGIGFMGKEWDVMKGDTRSWAGMGGPTGRRHTGGTGDRTPGGAMIAGGYDLSARAMHGFAAWCETWAREALRVLKPGGHLLAFGGTRTFHRLTCGIEDAGFEIRDCLSWLYGSGFPKSLDVSKAIDKRRDDREDVLRVTAEIRRLRDAAGLTNRDLDGLFGFAGMAGHWTTSESQPAVPTIEQWATLRDVLSPPEWLEREVWRLNGRKGEPGDAWHEREVVGVGHGAIVPDPERGPRHTVGGHHREFPITAPATAAAREWQGWGTALKPGWEPCVVARKPLAGTVAENVQRYGTGALNIDGCRIAHRSDADRAESEAKNQHTRYANPASNRDSYSGNMPPRTDYDAAAGRWPANVALDEAAAAMLDAQSGERQAGAIPKSNNVGFGGVYTDGTPRAGVQRDERVEMDSGGASRFFYTAKASRADRNTSGATNTHPTVKPTDLMRWLVRLVTPPGGVVLDPFAGSGSTLVAARAEGFRAIGIEREEEYAAIIADRLSQLSLFSEAI